MANNRIRSGGNDLLLSRNLDDSRRKGVDFENSVHNHESEHDQCISCNRRISWSRRPPKPVIERGNGEVSNECNSGYQLDNLLTQLFFPARTGFQSALEQRWIVL